MKEEAKWRVCKVSKMKGLPIQWSVLVCFLIKWSCITQSKEEKMKSRLCSHNWLTDIKFNETFATNRKFEIDRWYGQFIKATWLVVMTKPSVVQMERYRVKYKTRRGKKKSWLKFIWLDACESMTQQLKSWG